MSFLIADPSSFLATPGFAATMGEIERASLANRKLSEPEAKYVALIFNAHMAAADAAFSLFTESERKWRTAVFQGEIEYEEATEKLVEDRLRIWVEKVGGCVSYFDDLQLEGLDRRWVERLRAVVSRARAMLTPDDDFFEGDELDNLASEAMADDEAGRTVEFQVTGE